MPKWCKCGGQVFRLPADDQFVYECEDCGEALYAYEVVEESRKKEDSQ